MLGAAFSAALHGAEKAMEAIEKVMEKEVRELPEKVIENSEFDDLPEEIGSGEISGIDDLPEEIGSGEVSGIDDLPEEIGSGEISGIDSLPEEIGSGEISGIDDLPEEIGDNVSSETAGMPDEIGNEATERDSKHLERDVTTENTQESDAPKKKGGRYADVFNDGEGDKYEVHHMPADSASNLERNDGPAIKMEKADHRQTASCGNSKEAREYRETQKKLIEEGKFREALQMDIDDIHEKFGDKYDDAISEMLEYVDKLEAEGKING